MSKNARVNVNVTEEQKQRWSEWAERKGQSLPGFVRYAVEVYIAMLQKSKKV